MHCYGLWTQEGNKKAATSEGCKCQIWKNGASPFRACCLPCRGRPCLSGWQFHCCCGSVLLCRSRFCRQQHEEVEELWRWVRQARTIRKRVGFAGRESTLAFTTQKEAPDDLSSLKIAMKCWQINLKRSFAKDRSSLRSISFYKLSSLSPCRPSTSLGGR